MWLKNRFFKPRKAKIYVFQPTKTAPNADSDPGPLLGWPGDPPEFVATGSEVVIFTQSGPGGRGIQEGGKLSPRILGY